MSFFTNPSFDQELNRQDSFQYPLEGYAKAAKKYKSY